MIPPMTSLSLRPQNILLEEPLATSSKELVKSQDKHKKVRVESMEMSVKEEHVGGFCDQMLDAHVAGEHNHQANSYRGYSHSGIWQGHEVNPEFVDLLDVIMKKYPKTFEYFTTKSNFCTMELNTLCISVNAFTRTSLVDVDTEMINEYKALFADLQRSFNIEWLTLCKKKTAKIQNAFGTKDKNIHVGCIGGDLLYGL
ncbi:hypothetical protein POM88_028842 [Heracleum sosnowskyi]|uniref:Uncharacterized protein n=1 Tax=Heracleum sosnowskyi TaxID=360622 RepID=A0AAD8MH41_9APIA|nr:hypothetical protein POM88_028842 [Heracleum sosnowskyi]